MRAKKYREADARSEKSGLVADGARGPKAPVPRINEPRQQERPKNKLRYYIPWNRASATG